MGFPDSQEARNAPETAIRGGYSRYYQSYWASGCQTLWWIAYPLGYHRQKQFDTASPKMMSAKPTKKMKPTRNRADPYKNYNFR